MWYNKYNKETKEIDTMMKISEMIAMMAQVMADHGDKEVVFVNDETGEIRYAMGMTVEGDMVVIDHISYGEKAEIEAVCAFAEFMEMMMGGEQ